MNAGATLSYMEATSVLPIQQYRWSDTYISSASMVEEQEIKSNIWAGKKTLY